MNSLHLDVTPYQDTIPRPETHHVANECYSFNVQHTNRLKWCVCASPSQPKLLCCAHDFGRHADQMLIKHARACMLSVRNANLVPFLCPSRPFPAPPLLPQAHRCVMVCLAVQAMRVVKPGGMLMTCSCSGAVTLDDHFVPMLKVSAVSIISAACSQLPAHCCMLPPPAA